MKYRRKGYGTNYHKNIPVAFESDSGREYMAVIDIAYEWDDNADTDADGNRGHATENVYCDEVHSVMTELSTGRRKVFKLDKIPMSLKTDMDKAIDRYCENWEGM